MANFIPGINVGNAFKQLGSYVGLAPKADYDIFDGWTLGNTSASRAGQRNLLNSTYVSSPVSGQPQNTQTQPNNDPNDNNPNQTPGVYDGPWYGSGSGGGSYAAPIDYAKQNANAISQLEQSGRTVQGGIDRLGGQLNIALGNIDTQKRIKDNEAQTQRDSTQKQYGTSTTSNRQDYRTNRNVITDQASSGLSGLMRLLGANGAVGSDLSLAGRAVADEASIQNSGAGQAYSKNQQALDTNWGNYKNEWEEERKKRDDWQRQQRDAATAQSETTRQDLLSKLADIRGQISAAKGGKYADGAQQYIDQANGLNSRIDELGRLNPTYTGNVPQYKQATLGSYQAKQAGTQVSDPSQIASGLNTPWLNALMGLDKEKKLV